METDREVLLWFHQRLVHQHKESYLFDYMHRLRWIIAGTPAKKVSRGQKAKKTCNSVKELKHHIKHLSEMEQELIEAEPRHALSPSGSASPGPSRLGCVGG